MISFSIKEIFCVDTYSKRKNDETKAKKNTFSLVSGVDAIVIRNRKIVWKHDPYC